MSECTRDGCSRSIGGIHNGGGYLYCSKICEQVALSKAAKECCSAADTDA